MPTNQNEVIKYFPNDHNFRSLLEVYVPQIKTQIFKKVEYVSTNFSRSLENHIDSL